MSWRDIRIAAGMSIQEAAQSLATRTHILKAIEDRKRHASATEARCMSDVYGLAIRRRKTEKSEVAE
jgi:hypothetical protein